MDGIGGWLQVDSNYVGVFIIVQVRKGHQVVPSLAFGGMQTHINLI